MTVALNNLVNSNFGVKEYNVHMAADGDRSRPHPHHVLLWGDIPAQHDRRRRQGLRPP